MEGSESSITRIGRTIWTVWGYLTGTVGRYLRPEVTNEGNPNAHSKEKDPVLMTVNKSYKELNENEEEKERSEARTCFQHERKMREVAGLQHSGVRVRSAAVQWEKLHMKGDSKGNGDHDEDSGTSKHTCSGTERKDGDQDESSEDLEKKAQELRCNEEPLDYHLDDKPRKTLSTDLVEEDTNLDSQVFDVSGGEDPDLDAKINANNQEQRRKSEKEGDDYMMECVVDGKQTIDSENVEQGLGHEQTNRCNSGDEEYIKETSVENVINYANNQDIKEENDDKQRHQEKGDNEDKTHEDEDLSQLLYPTSEGGGLLKVLVNKEVMYKEEVSTNKVTPESEVIDRTVETEQRAMGKINNGQLEQLTACAAQQLCEFTGNEIFDNQKMNETQKEHIEEKIEMECEIKEFVAAQMGNAEISQKETEFCSKRELRKVTFAVSSLALDANLLTVTMESDLLDQHKEDTEVRTTSEALKTEVSQLDDRDYISGSQRSEVVIKQGIESVIASVEAEDGNQNKTIDPMLKCTQDTKAEVSSEDVMKSVMEQMNLHEHSTDGEGTLQETVYQYSLEQEPGQEISANGDINETGLLKAPFYELLSEIRGTEPNSAGPTDETAVECIDEMSSPSLQELDKTQCSIELSADLTTKLIVETKTTSPEQKLLLVKHSEVTGTSKPTTTEVNCRQGESVFEVTVSESESSITTSETCTRSTEANAPFLFDLSKSLNLLRDQINYSECQPQTKSVFETESHGSKHGSSEISDPPERESSLTTLEMWRNSQKDTEEGTSEIAPGLPDEMKAITALRVWGEVMSGLTMESKERQSELSRQIESPDNRITGTEEEKIELLNDMVEHRKYLQEETMNTGSEACGQTEVGKMSQYTTSKQELQVELTAEGERDMPHNLASVSEVTVKKKEHKEKADEHKTVVDSNENLRDRNRPGLKRGLGKMEREEKSCMSKDWAITDLLQVSSLDFTVQKSKIAVKNPRTRPPKDCRTLINMTSVEPLAPPCSRGPSPLKKSPAERVSVPGKGVLGFKLPGLGSGLPALRQTEAGRKMRDGEDAQCVTSQKSGTQTDPAENYVVQDQKHDKPKSTPPRLPGMGSQQMMMELKNKLKKNKNAKE